LGCYNYTTSFYKELFGLVDNRTSISLENHVPCVLDNDDRDILTAEFTLEEIKTALFQLKHNKVPGLDGFLAEFYQHF
jgi:hypothetical protein